MLTMHWPAHSRRYNGIGEISRRMNHLFNGIHNTECSTCHDNSPEGKIFDQGESLLFTLDVPGISSDDINLELKDGVMTITGERQSMDLEGYKRHRLERDALKFHHSFKLPVSINSDRNSDYKVFFELFLI